MAASTRAAIDVEDLQAGSLQALDQHRYEPFHHLIPKIVILLALAAQTAGVHGDCTGQFERPGVVGPAVRRHQPGHADDLADTNSLKSDRAAPRRRHGKSNASMADEIEPVRGFAFAKEILAFFKAHILGAAADQLAELFAQAGEKPMLSNDALEPFYDRLLQRVALLRIARTSSVISMPTGHHVMQRPQPTQPEVPNWSNQVASLWVIHWR